VPKDAEKSCNFGKIRENIKTLKDLKQMPSVFSSYSRRFQCTQRWPDGLDLCWEDSLCEQVMTNLISNMNCKM